MRFRQAHISDVFNIIKLYQKAKVSPDIDPLFLDYRRLEESIRSNQNLWVLTEIEGSVNAAIYLNFDWSQGLCKISRMIVDHEVEDAKGVLKECLRYVLHLIHNEHEDIDIVYTTTMSMSLEQQNITLEEGFKTLGIFPNAGGEDNTRMNGLTAFFYPGVLEGKRYDHFSSHPAVAPFSAISLKQCQLEQPPVQPVQFDTSSFKDVPELEIIEAPRFSRTRFRRLREYQSQILNFYPFYEPNCIICDENQEIEIFLRLRRANGFAAVIGEHVTMSVNPVQLYEEMQKILRQHGVNYIEIINDASDLFGIECILRSGFTPCAYFPAFKKQGGTRRDYVVFGKSFEYLCRPATALNSAYSDFYREYFIIEGKNYFPKEGELSNGESSNNSPAEV